MIGFDATKGANQDPGVMFWMRFLFSALPAILAVGGLILLRSYEIDEEKAMEIKADLDKRHLEVGDN